MSAFTEQYSIMFKSLIPGVHNFNFYLNNRFFEHFENPDCPGGAVTVSVKLDKKDHLLSFHLNFSGTARAVCDRCLEEFDLPLDFNSNLYVKFGEEGQEKDAEVIYLEQNEHTLNLADYFLESICLNLPIRRIHQKDSNGNELCNEIMIEKINELRVREKDKEPDPRWDSLKNIIIRKN